MVKHSKAQKNPPITHVFFGHGWSTGKMFYINKNINITMLKDAVSLVEDPTNKHKREYAKMYNSDNLSSDYTKYLIEKGNEMCNEFETFNDKFIPDLLLSTYDKGGELCELLKMGDLRATKLPSRVMLLSEMISYLSISTTLHLFVYSCRNKLDTFQIKHLDIFQDNGDILKKIKNLS